MAGNPEKIAANLAAAADHGKPTTADLRDAIRRALVFVFAVGLYSGAVAVALVFSGWSP